MVWRRLFRGWGSTSTTTVVEEETTEEAGSTPSSKGDEASADPAPRFGGFSFEMPRPPLDRTGEHEVVELDTMALAAVTVEAPTSAGRVDVAAAVRRKASTRRGLKAADRGVGPVLVPSLREQALVYRLAASERAADDPRSTLGLWQAWLDLEPTDGDAWFAYGQCLLQCGLLEEAWEAFSETRAHAPTNGLAAGALGYLAAVQGDLERAERHYRDAVALRPVCPDMLTALAETLERSDRPAEAVEVRERLDAVLSR